MGGWIYRRSRRHVLLGALLALLLSELLRPLCLYVRYRRSEVGGWVVDDSGIYLEWVLRSFLCDFKQKTQWFYCVE